MLVADAPPHLIEQLRRPCTGCNRRYKLGDVFHGYFILCIYTVYCQNNHAASVCVDLAGSDKRTVGQVNQTEAVCLNKKLNGSGKLRLRDEMEIDCVVRFLRDHWILIPLGVFVLVVIGFGLRSDRGALLFKSRKEVSPEEITLFDFYQVLKYGVIVLVLLNLLIKLLRGDYN